MSIEKKSKGDQLLFNSASTETEMTSENCLISIAQLIHTVYQKHYMGIWIFPIISPNIQYILPDFVIFSRQLNASRNRWEEWEKKWKKKPTKMETSTGLRKKESGVQFPVQHTGIIFNYNNHRFVPIICYLEMFHKFILLACTFFLTLNFKIFNMSWTCFL